MAPTPTFIEDARNNKEDKIAKNEPFPNKIEEVDKKINQELLTVFTGEKTSFLQVGPKKWFFPSGYKKEANNYYNFIARPDDVFVVTFPRSGTTWTQELVWLLANNLDYKRAAQIPLRQRFPFLEFSCFVHKEIKAQFLKENQLYPNKCETIEKMCYPRWKYLQEMPERRFIKTHLPLSLLPPNLLNVGSKVIYVARNPKDVAVSYYHLNRAHRTQGYIGDFDQFWNYFQKGLIAWSPYWEHVKEGWSQKDQNNLLFIFYEDMNKNLSSVMQKVANFLDKSYTDEEFAILENHLRIDNFKNNKSVNNDDYKDLGVLLSNEGSFVRKGTNGGWKSYFSDKLNVEADMWIQENIRSFGMEFPK